MARGTTNTARKAAPSPLDGKQSVDQAIAGILQNCLDHVLANRDAAESPDNVEGVHQMRVGLRRLRAVIQFLQRAIPARSLKRFDRQAERLADTLAPVRSIDALLQQIDTVESEVRAPGFSILRQAAAARRKQVNSLLQTQLRDPATTVILDEIGQWIARHGWRERKAKQLDAPARKLAERALDRLARKARKRGARFRKLPPRGRHKFRIALKKLRTVAKLFAPLFADRKTERYLKRVAKLLDGLGADHDDAMLPATLRSIGRPVQPPTARRAVKALLGARRAQRPALRKSLRKRRRQWKNAAPFW
jgi:CHAD domain-containing protein